MPVAGSTNKYATMWAEIRGTETRKIEKRDKTILPPTDHMARIGTKMKRQIQNLLNRESRCAGTGHAHNWGKENSEMIKRASLSSKGKLGNGEHETENKISNSWEGVRQKGHERFYI